MVHSNLSSERLPAPDLIRGIALIGIGAENMLSFNAANEHIAAYVTQFPDPINKAVLLVFMLFLRGKFYPIFAFLFGFAAALSLTQRGEKPFFRRSLFIGVLGFLQLLFIWNGDVLLQYAFLGLVLFALKDLPVSLLFSLTGLLFLLSFLLPGFLPPNHSVFVKIPPEIYAKGSFLTLLRYRMPEFMHSFLSLEFYLFLGRIFGFMLLGYLLGRNNNYLKFLNGKTAANWFVIALLSLIACGFILQFTGLRGEDIRSTSQEFIKAMILAVFYLANVLVLLIGSLLLFMKFPKLRIWLPLIAVGRMTLTHYLVQNLLFSFIFYGFGLGLYLQITPLQLWAGYALLILMQALISMWWLKNFRQGPVEKLLRRFAYA